MKAKIIPDFDHIKILSKIKTSENCWEWKGYIGKDGYGVIKINGRLYKSHRLCYVIFKGDLNIDLVIDHACKNRSCVNPDHLREVTHRFNNVTNSISPIALNSLKTHCKNGHEFTEGNTLMKKDGRRCRSCKRNNEKGRVRSKSVRA